MKTRCKFRCDSVTLLANEQKSVSLSAVVGSSEENKTFWKYTPSGSLTFNCLNASVQFEPGKEYYVDIELANGA